MKILILLLLAALPAFAQNARVAWDKSSTPGISNYVLYGATNAISATNLATAAFRLNVGTNLTASIEAMNPGTYWLAVTAQKAGIESLPSNILVMSVPQPPANMRTVVVQFSATLTNFTDFGFFRVRLD